MYSAGICHEFLLFLQFFNDLNTPIQSAVINAFLFFFSLCFDTQKSFNFLCCSHENRMHCYFVHHCRFLFFSSCVVSKWVFISFAWKNGFLSPILFKFLSVVVETSFGVILFSAFSPTSLVFLSLLILFQWFCKFLLVLSFSTGKLTPDMFCACNWHVFAVVASKTLIFLITLMIFGSELYSTPLFLYFHWMAWSLLPSSVAFIIFIFCIPFQNGQFGSTGQFGSPVFSKVFLYFAAKLSTNPFPSVYFSSLTGLCCR